jgi:enolase
MIEYYIKLLSEHPLTTYIEDAFTQYDFATHRLFKTRIQNDLKNVKMGLK